jgi:hypothetical protein
MHIAIQYVEVSGDGDNIPEAFLILKGGDTTPTTIPLRKTAVNASNECLDPAVVLDMQPVG